MGASVTFTAYALLCSMCAGVLDQYNGDFNVFYPPSVVQFANDQVTPESSPVVALNEIALKDSAYALKSHGHRFIILVDYTKSTDIKEIEYPKLNEGFSGLRQKFRSLIPDDAPFQSLIVGEMLDVILKEHENTESYFTIGRIEDGITTSTDDPDPWIRVNKDNIRSAQAWIGKQRVVGEKTDFVSVLDFASGILQSMSEEGLNDAVLSIVSDFAHDMDFGKNPDRNRRIEDVSTGIEQLAHSFSKELLSQISLVILPLSKELGGKDGDSRGQFQRNSKDVLGFFDTHFKERFITPFNIESWQNGSSKFEQVIESAAHVRVEGIIRRAVQPKSEWKSLEFRYEKSNGVIGDIRCDFEIGGISQEGAKNLEITLQPDGPYPPSLYMKCTHIDGSGVRRNEWSVIPNATKYLPHLHPKDRLSVQLRQMPSSYFPDLRIELFQKGWNRRYHFPIVLRPRLSVQNAILLKYCAVAFMMFSVTASLLALIVWLTWVFAGTGVKES